MKLFTLALLSSSLLLFPHRAAAQNMDDYFCNYAKVTLPAGSNAHAIVRSGAGKKYRQIDKLNLGQVVYICDERGDWFNVYYSSPTAPCRAGTEDGLEVTMKKDCQVGWIDRRLIDVISG